MPESPGGLAETQMAGSHFRVSVLVGLWWGLNTCTSTEFLGDAAVAGPRNTL